MNIEELRIQRDAWAEMARLETSVCSTIVKRAEEAEREYQEELKRITIATQQQDKK